jgi:hypothetical protein
MFICRELAPLLYFVRFLFGKRSWAKKIWLHSDEIAQYIKGANERVTRATKITTKITRANDKSKKTF